MFLRDFPCILKLKICFLFQSKKCVKHKPFRTALTFRNGFLKLRKNVSIAVNGNASVAHFIESNENTLKFMYLLSTNEAIKRMNTLENNFVCKSNGHKVF